MPLQHQILGRLAGSISVRTAVIVIALGGLFLRADAAEPSIYWNGNGGNTLWSNDSNWFGGTATTYGTLEFNDTHNTGTTLSDDIASLNQHSLRFASSTSFTINSGVTGATITFFNYADGPIFGEQSSIRNDGVATNTINVNLDFAAGTGPAYAEINVNGGSLIFGGTVSITGGGVDGLLVTASKDATFNGAISGTNKNVTASTTGTVTLNAANTYTGTTSATAGTLLINGNQSSANGAVSVTNAGTTLGGTGTVGGAVTINANGTITGAAKNSIGTLTLSSDLTFTGTDGANLANYFVDIGSGANNSDRLAIGGTLDLSTSFDQILFNGTPDGTSSYILATYTSRNGTFDVGSAPAGYQFVYGATELDLVPIPEPSTWAAGILTVGALGFSQRGRVRRFLEARLTGCA